MGSPACPPLPVPLLVAASADLDTGLEVRTRLLLRRGRRAGGVHGVVAGEKLEAQSAASQRRTKEAPMPLVRVAIDAARGKRQGVGCLALSN